MLQQTQVARVLQKYPPFIRRYPRLSAISAARTSELIRSWQGMGYNRRALQLKRLAQTVAIRYGAIPSDPAELLQLPGVGRYTANAVACFAFGKQVTVVDTNVRRVLGRVYPEESRRRDAWEVAGMVLPKNGAEDWNQALMDLGSTLCTASNPSCTGCPIAHLCPSAFRVALSSRRPRTRLSKPARVPDRIYRGRIVDALRNLPSGKTAGITTIARSLRQDALPAGQRKILLLLRGLERDGLISLTGSGSSVRAALPQ